jgi:hypothetical protein
MPFNDDSVAFSSPGFNCIDDNSKNPRLQSARHRAYARCLKRKIKCDLAYRQCGMCAAVGTECIGFSLAVGEEQPRNLVSFLEEKAL